MPKIFKVELSEEQLGVLTEASTRYGLKKKVMPSKAGFVRDWIKAGCPFWDEPKPDANVDPRSPPIGTQGADGYFWDGHRFRTSLAFEIAFGVSPEEYRRTSGNIQREEKEEWVQVTHDSADPDNWHFMNTHFPDKVPPPWFREIAETQILYQATAGCKPSTWALDFPVTKVYPFGAYLVRSADGKVRVEEKRP